MSSIVDKSDPPQGTGEALSSHPAAATVTQQTADQSASGCDTREAPHTLQLLFSGRAGVIFEAPRPLHADSLAIGRTPSASSIGLPDDERVSRQHATLHFEGGGWRIADDSSRNGVFVNGERVKAFGLRDGDLIRVGNSFLVFRSASGTLSARSAAAPSQPATAELLGWSPAMVSLRQTIEQVGPSDAAVLLLGESGTGKELTARALHRLSPRAKGPFTAVNCANLPEQLAESLLFGHERGAFTGATASGEGWFRAANHGTLFLDEIADLSPVVQPKLLRAIEQKQIFPVGATRPVDVDIRIIAATNHDLIKGIKQDHFRGELFFRLAGAIVQLPPLRQRKEDILPILLSAWPKSPPRLTPNLVEALLLHPWPYNVRELLTIAKELQIKGRDTSELDLALVAERLAMQKQLSVDEHTSDTRPIAVSPPPESRIPSREELLELLRETGGNISAIARKKEVSRTQVTRWLEARGIDKDRV